MISTNNFLQGTDGSHQIKFLKCQVHKQLLIGRALDRQQHTLFFTWHIPIIKINDSTRLSKRTACP